MIYQHVEHAIYLDIVIFIIILMNINYYTLKNNQEQNSYKNIINKNSLSKIILTFVNLMDASAINDDYKNQYHRGILLLFMKIETFFTIQFNLYIYYILYIGSINIGPLDILSICPFYQGFQSCVILTLNINIIKIETFLTIQSNLYMN